MTSAKDTSAKPFGSLVREVLRRCLLAVLLASPYVAAAFAFHVWAGPDGWSRLGISIPPIVMSCVAPALAFVCAGAALKPLMTAARTWFTRGRREARVATVSLSATAAIVVGTWLTCIRPGDPELLAALIRAIPTLPPPGKTFDASLATLLEDVRPRTARLYSALIQELAFDAHLAAVTDGAPAPGAPEQIEDALERRETFAAAATSGTPLAERAAADLGLARVAWSTGDLDAMLASLDAMDALTGLACFPSDSLREALALEACELLEGAEAAVSDRATQDDLIRRARAIRRSLARDARASGRRREEFVHRAHDAALLADLGFPDRATLELLQLEAQADANAGGLDAVSEIAVLHAEVEMSRGAWKSALARLESPLFAAKTVQQGGEDRTSRIQFRRLRCMIALGGGGGLAEELKARADRPVRFALIGLALGRPPGRAWHERALGVAQGSLADPPTPAERAELARLCNAAGRWLAVSPDDFR